MNKNYFLCGCVLASLLHQSTLTGQCASPVSIGSSANMLTMIRNNSNPVAVNRELNAMVFIHRNNHTVFGGNSGQLRYDLSTNGGTSFSNNQGVLNPMGSSLARYPNIGIHNPLGNTNPNNAFMGYAAATTNGSNWNGVVTGSRQLSGSGNTESYNQPGAASYLIAGSLVKGAPGVFWALDYTSNGTIATGGINVYKGVWNISGNITWATTTVLSPNYNTSYSGSPRIGDINIAFDPSGVTGWICLMTHLSSGPSAYGYYPTFYKTTNGGASWTGPISVNLNQLSCISANISSGNGAAAHHAADLAVDVYGNPHLLTTIGNGNGNYDIDNYQWHHMMDITQKNGVWTAYDIANVKCGPESFSGSVSVVTQYTSPQVTRTKDGTRVFFGWTDNSIYSTGDPNTWPDFFGRGFNVQQHTWTPVKDFTSCNINTFGSIYFPHLAEEVLEPLTGVYKLAPVYGQFTGGDPDQPANFVFLNNVLFNNADFSISQPTLNLSLSPTGTITLCPGNQVNLQISGSFGEVKWSNGSNLSSIIVNSPGVYHVAARNGCVLGADSVSVKSLTMAASANTTVCEGEAVSLSVSGNANGYVWNPGPLAGPAQTVFPAGNTIYTVTGFGYNNCSAQAMVNVTVKQGPAIIALSNRQLICAGEEIILQAAGASLYLWNTGATTSSISAFPTTTTVYTVTGINNEGCARSYTVSQQVDPCLGIESNNLVSELLVFPNPSNGDVHISGPSGAFVTLVNDIGQVVMQGQLQDAHGISVQNLAPGVYLLMSETGGSYNTRKIVVSTR